MQCQTPVVFWGNGDDLRETEDKCFRLVLMFVNVKELHKAKSYLQDLFGVYVESVVEGV